MTGVTPAVTVVIPCFNQARFLRAAIESVRRQSAGRIELIVVDDGSTDDTREVALAGGARLISQTNRGLSEARNAGLAAAGAGLIVMLDADDELLPDAVAIGRTELEAHPAALAAVGRCEVMDAAGRPLPAQYHEIDAADLYREWLSKNFVWTPGAAMFRRRALLDAGGFAPNLGPVADYALYLALARTGDVIVHRRMVVRYRQHEASMSRDPMLMLALTLEVLRRERLAAPAFAAEIRRGERAWRAWYGERIVRRLRLDWRDRRIGLTQARYLAVLLRYAPGQLLAHAGRKVRNGAGIP